MCKCYLPNIFFLQQIETGTNLNPGGKRQRKQFTKCQSVWAVIHQFLIAFHNNHREIIFNNLNWIEKVKMFQLCQHTPWRTLLLGGSRIPRLFARNISFAPKFFCFDENEKKNPLTITKIQNLFKCEHEQARSVFEMMNIKSQWKKGALLIDTLKVLINSGVTIESILENPRLFAISKYPFTSTCTYLIWHLLRIISFQAIWRLDWVSFKKWIRTISTISFRS